MSESRVQSRREFHRPPWFSSSFDYGFPRPAPVAVPGCEVCARMAAALAAITRDPSGAVDARVLMRRHLLDMHELVATGPDGLRVREGSGSAPDGC